MSILFPECWKDYFPPNASNLFNNYIQNFKNNGYKVWCTQNNHHATSYLQLTSKQTSESILISGRADYLITPNHATKANYLNEIIEIQSKDDEELCINQMLIYLLILMNTKNLKQVIGFWIYSNGLYSKSYQRSQWELYAWQNDSFHLTYIFQIFQFVLSSNN